MLTRPRRDNRPGAGWTSSPQAGAGLAALSGLVLVTAHQPVGAGPLAWVGLVPLYFAVLTARSARLAGLYGLIAGAVFFGIHLWWIFLFGWMAWTGLVLALSLYFGAAAALSHSLRRPLLVAGAWAGMELLRDSWPWGGFPWGSLGTSQASVPGVRWLAGVVGAYGISFLIALCAAVLAGTIAGRRGVWRDLAAAGGVLVAFVGADLAAYGRPPAAESIRVAVVQGSVPRPVTFDQDRLVFDSHLGLTEEALDPRNPPDLVVWPEGAIASSVGAAGLREAQLAAERLQAPMLLGRTQTNPQDREFRNVVEHIDSQGRVVATYLKRHPVPFGEYVPMPRLRSRLSTLDQIPYDMARGAEAVVFDVDGHRVGTPICFESVFPRDVRAFTRAGAELIVVTTNNSSYERSPASAQHLAHARMRALENRQWVVQAALSGISAVAAPDGTLSDPTGLFERRILDERVGVRPAHSLYARTGDVFSFGWAGLALLALGLRAFGRTRPRLDDDDAAEPGSDADHAPSAPRLAWPR